jgi:hypothetical protein
MPVSSALKPAQQKSGLAPTHSCDPLQSEKTVYSALKSKARYAPSSPFRLFSTSPPHSGDVSSPSHFGCAARALKRSPWLPRSLAFSDLICHEEATDGTGNWPLTLDSGMGVQIVNGLGRDFRD